MEQKFYCKKCEKEFSIVEDDKYWNYNCPICNIICVPKDYTPVGFKGLPNTKC